MKQDGDWWIGWIEEVPGVNCQEQSKAEFVQRLREALGDAIDFNRREALSVAGDGFLEQRIAV